MCQTMGNFLSGLGIAIGAIALVISFVVLVTAIGGALVWVAMGLAHSVWSVIPALTYYEACVVAFALSILKSLLFGATVSIKTD